jgi:hypothetical protein
VAVLAAVATLGTAGAAGAVTVIDFNGEHGSPYRAGGFTLAPARIVNGNCLSGGCLALNDNETTSLSGPGSFTLSGLSFNLLGKGTGNALTVTGSNGTSLSFDVGDFAKNSYHTLAFADAFADVSSIVFSTSGGGNLRIDDLAVQGASPVPLPAAAWLLLGGLGAIGALGRRARSAA